LFKNARGSLFDHNLINNNNMQKTLPMFKVKASEILQKRVGYWMKSIALERQFLLTFCCCRQKASRTASWCRAGCGVKKAMRTPRGMAVSVSACFISL
jgi:hypothetical protein